MFKTLIIANRTSGNFNQKKFDEVVDIIKTKCDIVDVVYTEYRGHGRVIAEEAEYNLIISAGGDGIVNEVAGGVTGTPKMFYALPFGTVNVFCSEYGIGKCPVKAAKMMNINNPASIPAGYVNEHFFVLMAGFGFDANTVKRVEEKKHKYKKLAHIINGLPSLFKDKYEEFILYNNGKKEKYYHGIFAVAKNYGGSFSLGKIRKDRINAFLVRKNGIISIIKSFLPLFLGFGFKGKYIESEYFKLEGVSSCQLDGEFVELNKSSVYISLKYSGVNLVLPSNKI